MAMSEVFNLDFKFGGNAEFLVKLEALLNRIDARFDSFEDDVKESTKATEEMSDAVDDLSDSFKDGMDSISRFGDKLKDIAKYYLSFQAIRSGAERVWSFGMQSMEAYSTQERAENQLKGVMRNRGNLDQFQTIKDYAAQIQGKSIYGDEAMIRGAGELATYVKGTESLKSMMSLLTDYAAGMTGGGEVSPEQMESLATGLGMAYDGNYMAMRRKGFDTSKLEALDALAENGGKWNSKLMQKYGKDWDDEQKKEWAEIVKQAKKSGGITEQMRVDALKESLQDWKGLSDQVNKLDSSALIRFNNKLGDLRENIGKKLYPVFNRLVEGIEKNMPTIESAFEGVGEIFETLASTIINNLDALKTFVKYISAFLKTVAEQGPMLIKMYIAGQGVSKVLPLLTSDFGKLKDSAAKLISSNSLGLVAAALTALVATTLTLREKVIQNRNDERLQGGNEAAAKAKEVKSTKFRDAKYGAKRYDEERHKLAAIASQYAQSHDGEIPQEWYDILKTDYYGNVSKNPLTYKENPGTKLERLKYVRGDGNRTGDDFASVMKRELEKQGKVELQQTFNNTTINQKVNVAAEVEKIGMLLNLSVRAAIEQAMRKDKNQMAVGNI